MDATAIEEDHFVSFSQTENLSFTYDPEEQIKKYALQGLNISIDKGFFCRNHRT